MNIIALFQNNRISFYSDDNNQISHIKNSSLFFYFDNINNTFNNSDKYEIFTLENNSNVYSNIISNFEKNEQTNNPLAKNYGFFIEEIFSDITNTYKNYEKIELFFSNSIQKSEKEKIISFLSSKYKISKKSLILPEISIKNYILKNQTGTAISSINIIETIEQDLILSQCNYQNQKITISSEKEYTNFIFEPTAYSIAKTIVDDINRLYKTKNNKEQIKNNITYNYLKIKNKATEIENLPKKFATINTKFIESNERFTVRIDNSKLNLLKKVYI
ncbi:MAG: hypothetical protein U9Q83_07040, partial [Bacteroidota bacterium]|nr:hypothetical protein [Bacteroidota bacterium]